MNPSGSSRQGEASTHAGLSKVARKTGTPHSADAPSNAGHRPNTSRKVATRSGPPSHSAPARAVASQPTRRTVAKSTSRVVNAPAQNLSSNAPMRQHAAPRLTATKQVPVGRGEDRFRAPSAHVPPSRLHVDLTAKSSPLRPPWTTQDEARPSSVGHGSRAQNGFAGRSTAPRMMASAAIRRPDVAAAPLRLHARDHGHGFDRTSGEDAFYLERGLVLRRLGGLGAEIQRDQSAMEEPHPMEHRAGPSALRNDRPEMQIGRKSSGFPKQARKKVIDESMEEIPDTSDSGSEESESEGIEQLTAALDALTLPMTRMKEYRQLPFLLRNLRKGFRHRCQLLGVKMEPKTTPEAPISVLYRYNLDDDDNTVTSADSGEYDYEEWQGRMVQWDCPLCQLHPSFDTREMLRFHLQCDHAEVQVLWRGIERNGKQTWQIVLTVSDVDDDDSSEDEEDEESDLDSQVPGQVPLKEEDEEDELDELFSTPSRTPRPTPSSAAEVDEVDEALRMSGSISVASPPMIQPELLSPEPPVFIPKKFRAESPTPATAPRARRTVQPSRGSLPERYPTPPPPDDLLGPSAQYPYLPDGANAEEYYSCRPGGPRIYDLLNALSLEPFGVLSWVIVDREEELFEMDDIRDEDKVMMALWNRWIMLNRTKFIMEPYRNSIIKFVDQYWRMIHRAAGWAALRAFLLMLASNRFLKASEIVEILKHYESYTGMDQWYKDHDAEA